MQYVFVPLFFMFTKKSIRLRLLNIKHLLNI